MMSSTSLFSMLPIYLTASFDSSTDTPLTITMLRERDRKGTASVSRRSTDVTGWALAAGLMTTPGQTNAPGQLSTVL